MRSSLVPGASDQGGEPHPALLLALPYMRLPDLFSCQQVCRSLQDAITTNPLVWRSIVVEPPLSFKLTDDALWEVTSKAEGKLECLALVDCWHITDAGLRLVVDWNPTLSKIFLHRSAHLSADGVVSLAQSLDQGVLKHIRVFGISGLSKDHLSILKALVSKGTHQKTVKPFYYSKWRSQRITDNDGRSIDVDICPRCDGVGLVFDCTREACRATVSQTGCRGCLSCIDRCADCGGCVDRDEESDTLCQDLLCLECWLAQSKCRECNRPYCSHHGHYFVLGAGPAGFLCKQCQHLAAKRQDTDWESD